ncbi:MAG: outer membrane beta-barrel protein [Tannerella sp.]|jgi:outer membrane protein W|nr:outer membrane beta-barrel protein [Tannerella sp.]
MKRNVLLTGMFVLSTLTATAQFGSIKPEKGAVLLETGIAPFSEEGSIQLQEGQIKGVYMLSDNIGVRAGLGFNTASYSNDNGLKDDEWEKEKISGTQISFTPGLVRFFSGTENLSPYIGAELILATESNRTTLEAQNYKQVIKNEGGLMNTFGLGLFSGFNYYFSESLYVGVEINLALRSKTPKYSIIETTDSGSKETIEPTKGKIRNTEFKTACNPLIRIGWSF